MGKKVDNVGSSNPYKKYYGTSSKTTGARLWVKEQARDKMNGYVDLCPTEIGWMGFVKIYERKDEETGLVLPGAAILEDVFLYEQEVSAGSVDSGDAINMDIGQILNDLAETAPDKVEQLRFFAHSHVNMGVTPSGIDTDMIDDWAATGLDWFFSHIQNKKGEYDCRLDFFLPFRISIPVTLEDIKNQAQEERIIQEIENKVSVKKFQSSYDSSKGWDSFRGDQTGQSYKHLPTEGTLTSEVEDRILDDASLGTIDHPTVRYVTKEVQWKNNRISRERIRQEIVRGIIIHESLEGSPAAKSRQQMTTAEKWCYYRDHIVNDNRNKKLKAVYTERIGTETRPPQDQLEMSRSIQRSDTKRTSGTEDEGKQLQTPSQNGAKNDSGKKQPESKQGKQGKSNSDTTGKAESAKNKKQGNAKGKKESPSSRESEQEKLSVAEGADESEAARDLREAIEESGYAV